MEEELKCKICGKLASEDKKFVKSKMLCRRHNKQMLKHGKITYIDYPGAKKECDICGCIDSCKYYMWHGDDQYYGKTLCNRHYSQLKTHHKLLDTEYIMPKEKVYWTDDEKKEFEKLYRDGLTFEEISIKINRSINSLNNMSNKLNLGEKYMRSNNPNFEAVYQDYDWCFERYIIQGMSHKKMADECGASLRVIQKWCVEKFHLDSHTFRSKKQLSNLQKELIIFGTLGDGHIDKRENLPLYIESHSEGEKEYIFWKYEILKDLCNNEPRYYPSSYSSFGEDKKYLCKPFYRLNTKILDGLYEIRNMPRLDKIKQLNELGLSTHMLDDGSRDSLWSLCLAEYTEEEILTYIDICDNRFNLKAYRNKDVRYIYFDAPSSRKLDDIILRNIPNELDIIKKKITCNKKIPKPNNYIFVIVNDVNIGLNSYCRSHHIAYNKAKQIVSNLNINLITEDKLLNELKGV